MNGRKKSKSHEEIRSKSDTRICELPDEILHNILGLLPISEAVRSCVLARRWKQLWRSMPFLIFKEYDKNDNPGLGRISSKLITLVDRICTLRDPYYPIQRFELEVSFDDQPVGPKIKDHIENAVKCGVQHLDLTLFSQYEPLPSCIFSSEKLVHCKISVKMGMWNTPIKLPDPISLPRIKDLYLERIMFPDFNSMQQICSCPLLENLSMTNCAFNLWKPKVVTVSAPNLKRLSLRYTDMPSLRMHCKSLKKLDYFGKLFGEIHISGMKLDHASISPEPATSACMNHVVKLLNCVSSTKVLYLYTICHDLEGHLLSSYLTDLTQFDNVIDLFWCQILPKTAHTMLRKFPYLQYLEMDISLPAAAGVEPTARMDPLPLHHLKNITLTYLYDRGLECIEFHLVSMLLMSSAVLDTMVLCTGYRSYEDGIVLEILRSLPKLSKNCRISHTSIYPYSFW